MGKMAHYTTIHSESLAYLLSKHTIRSLYLSFGKPSETKFYPNKTWAEKAKVALKDARKVSRMTVLQVCNNMYITLPPLEHFKRLCSLPWVCTPVLK
jgi:hypothetical protein